jgi:hypothetical protein
MHFCGHQLKGQSAPHPSKSPATSKLAQTGQLNEDPLAPLPTGFKWKSIFLAQLEVPWF